MSSRWEAVSTFERLGLDALLDAWWARVEQDTGRREEELMLRRRVQASAEHISKIFIVAVPLISLTWICVAGDQIQLDDAELRDVREFLLNLGKQRRREQREQRQRERREQRQRERDEQKKHHDCINSFSRCQFLNSMLSSAPEGEDSSGSSAGSEEDDGKPRQFIALSHFLTSHR